MQSVVQVIGGTVGRSQPEPNDAREWPIAAESNSRSLGGQRVSVVVEAIESLAVLIAVSVRMSAFPTAPGSTLGTSDGDVYRRSGPAGFGRFT
jgi:hypothetical protein